MKITGFFPAAFLFLGFFACGVDDMPPAVQIQTELMPTSVAMGDSMRIAVQFTDNEALNQFKIDIHSNHDGHSHGKTQQALAKWDTLIIGSLSGSSDAIDFSIKIPTGFLPGPYHFTVYCLDKNGNESSANIPLLFKDATDTVAPVVQLQIPMANATISSPFSVQASISDQLSDGSAASELNRVEVILKSLSSQEEFEVVDFNAVQLAGSSSLYDPATGQLNISNLDVPSGASSGNYTLFLYAFDAYFNLGKAEVQIAIP